MSRYSCSIFVDYLDGHGVLLLFCCAVAAEASCFHLVRAGRWSYLGSLVRQSKKARWSEDGGWRMEGSFVNVLTLPYLRDYVPIQQAREKAH